MHELRGSEEPSLQELLSRMQNCDLVLIEGFKQGGFPKLEVWRASLEKKPLWPQLIGTIVIASDKKISGVGIAELDLGDVPTIANFVLKNALPIMEV